MSDTWNDYAFPHIQEIAKTDKLYQELSESAEQKWTQLQPIREKLTPEEWQSIEDYVARCEALEYYFAQLAYRYGKQGR